MLSLETCRALAERYAEVREHEWRYGDLAWYRHDDLWYVINTIGSTDTEAAPDSVYWCPRVGDLLNIAQIHAGCFHLNQHSGFGAPGQYGEWGAFDCHEGEGGSRGLGDTPEAAVAAWLLARKEA